MPKAEAKTVARSFFSHIEEKQISRAAEMLAPNFVYRAPGFPELQGPSEWATLMGAFHASSPQLQIHVEEQVAEGNTVITRMTCRTVHEHEFMGMPPTGRRLAWQSIAVHRFDDDGRITEEFVLDDYLGVFRQLGAVPLSILQETMDVPGGLGVRAVPVSAT